MKLGKKLEIPDGSSKCPRCLHVGNTEADFGYRIMGGHKRSQSYCRLCRSSGSKKPAPGGRFVERRPKVSPALGAQLAASQAATAQSKSPAKTESPGQSVSTAGAQMAQLLLFGGERVLDSRRRRA